MPRTTERLFHVALDYTKSLAEMVAAGHYDYVSPDITDNHFPVVEGEASVDMVLVQFSRTVMRREILAELEGQHLRPATLPELLAFGAQYPDEQHKVLIVALDSVWVDHSYDRVGFLWDTPSGDRTLRHLIDVEWETGDSFLAVRK